MAVKHSRFAMFTKDPDVLPFSMFPKNDGWLHFARNDFLFLLLASIVTILASKEITFLWLNSLDYLYHLRIFDTELVIEVSRHKAGTFGIETNADAH